MPGPTTVPWTTWGGDLIVLVGLVYLQAAYLLGVGPLRRRFRLAPTFPRGQAATFTAGILVIYVALQSPLHALSEEYLFSAHMTQHLLLTLVAAPLLLLGTPQWLVRPLLRSRLFAAALRFATRPLFAFVIYNVALAFSHLPAFYDTALRLHDLHVAQHQVYLLTALLVWWGVCGPLPEVNRLPYPAQMLLLFGSTLPSFVVGAILTHATEPIYPTYVAAPRIWDWLSPIEDQRLGGLIMWIIGSFYYLIVMGVVFFTWFEREEAKSRARKAALAHQPQ